MVAHAERDYPRECCGAFLGRGRDVARAIHGQALPLLTLEMSGLMAISKQVLVRRGVFATTLMRDPEFPAADAGDLAELDRLWPALTSHFAV